MAEPAWLKPGDVVRCEVECLGYIENRIVAAEDARVDTPSTVLAGK
jgi:hypothetical protein